MMGTKDHPYRRAYHPAHQLRLGSGKIIGRNRREKYFTNLGSKVLTLYWVSTLLTQQSLLAQLKRLPGVPGVLIYSYGELTV